MADRGSSRWLTSENDVTRRRELKALLDEGVVTQLGFDEQNAIVRKDEPS